MSDYHINIFYSEEDAAYVADIPDLEACSAFGATAEKALAEVERAKEVWLAAARAAGTADTRAALPPGDLHALANEAQNLARSQRVYDISISSIRYPSR